MKNPKLKEKVIFRNNHGYTMQGYINRILDNNTIEIWFDKGRIINKQTTLVPHYILNHIQTLLHSLKTSIIITTINILSKNTYSTK